MPYASSCVSLILMLSQLLLAAVHASKLSWITFGIALGLIPITYLYSAHLQRTYATPLLVPPITRRAPAPTSVDQSSLVDAELADDGAALSTKSSTGDRTTAIRYSPKEADDDGDDDTSAAYFGDAFIQPELVHAQITSREWDVEEEPTTSTGKLDAIKSRLKSATRFTMRRNRANEVNASVASADPHQLRQASSTVSEADVPIATADVRISSS